MKIAIRQGRVIDPASQLNQITDIIIDNGKIIHIGPLPTDFVADKTIDASHQWVIPGLVDTVCRLNNLLEAKAALKRGITSLCIPPDQDIDNLTLYPLLQNDPSLPHCYLLGALTDKLAGNTVADLDKLAQNGCIAFTNAQYPIKDTRILRHCYQYAANFDLLVVIQPQDPWLNQGVAHEGFISTRLGLRGIPHTAETIAVAQHLLLIEECQVRAHFSCLSSARAVSQIHEAKKQGLAISADTAMHSLLLTQENLENFDANCHVNPPLRTHFDRSELLTGINHHTIDLICSDHRPLDRLNKLAPFADTQVGMSAIDTFLSLGIQLVNQQKLPLDDLINAITYQPAKIYRLPAGTLKIGATADICIIDPNQHWTVEENALYSQGKNTPFKHQTLPGVVTHTLLNGTIVHAI